MTGINLQVQNNNAAVYSNVQNKTLEQSQSRTNVISEKPNLVAGEPVTLSAEAIALSQQAQADMLPPPASPASNGFGVRPPSP